MIGVLGGTGDFGQGLAARLRRLGARALDLPAQFNDLGPSGLRFAAQFGGLLT